MTRGRSNKPSEEDVSIDAAIKPVLGLQGGRIEESDAETDTDIEFDVPPISLSNRLGNRSASRGESKTTLPPAIASSSNSIPGVGVTGRRIQFPDDDKLIVNEDKRLIEGLGLETWTRLVSKGRPGVQEVRSRHRFTNIMLASESSIWNVGLGFLECCRPFKLCHSVHVAGIHSRRGEGVQGRVEAG